jgi:molybdopterin converting factor small subunit
MRVEVLMFAGAREAVGARAVKVELSVGAKVCDLRDELMASYPGLRRWRDSAGIALGMEYAGEDEEIRPGVEIAFIPPVSGG